MGKTYEQGLEDAWELAKKIMGPIDRGGYSMNEITRIFNTDTYDSVFHTFSAKEALDRVKKYEGEIGLVIGDIVSVTSETGYTSFEAIFYGETVMEFWVLIKDNPVPQRLVKRSWVLTKTGRHVDMQSLFDAI